MKCSISFCLLLFFSTFFISPLFSQTSLGFENSLDGEYEAAVSAFKQDINDKTMGAFANYGLAQIYANPDFSSYNVDQAWTYFLAFDEAYKNLNSKKKDKYKKEFKIRSSKLKTLISEQAFNLVQEQKSVEAFDHFLDFYKKSKLKYRNEVAIQRNQLAYENALKTNTSKAFGDFLEKYKKSLKSKSKTLWKEGQLRFFETSMKENGWESYEDFAKNYRTNPYVKDSGGKGFRQIYSQPSKDAYIEFVDNHSKSLYQKIALHQLSKILLSEGTFDEYNWFLVSYSEHEAAAELWRKFYAMHKSEYGNNAPIEFAKQYPLYPFMDELTEEIKVIREAEAKTLYEKIKNSNHAFTTLSFLEKYPESEYVAQLEEKVYQQLIANPSIVTYEKFLNLYPDSKHFGTSLNGLYDLYSKDYNYKNIRSFIDSYGSSYSDADRLEKDLKLAKAYSQLSIKVFVPELENEFHDFILAAAPSRAAFLTLTKMIDKDIKSKNWFMAKTKMEKYQENFQSNSLAYNQLLNALKAPAQNVFPRNLSAQVNSDGSEYAPVISANNKTIYFCAKKRNDNLGKEDIFIAHKKSQDWSYADLLPDINSINSNEAPEAISVDGTQMLMFKSGQLCYSNKTQNGWSEIEYLPKVINATNWQGDASISSDGRAILFASTREDIVGIKQKGNMDIYVCIKDQEGEWDQVINLGHHINTPYLDRSPFLHPDMKTLYFSSAGHGGFGDVDVFKSTRLDDSWTNWSTPVNLGREINTTSRDWGYKISTDGRTAYFSFIPEGKDNEDIYFVELPKEMRPQEVSTIAGVLKDSEGTPIAAEIIIEDLANSKIVAELKSNPETGEFFVVLPDNRRYSYLIKKENYFPIANNIDLSGDQTIEINENLEMYTVAELTEKGMNITLKNIFFDHDKHELKPSSYSELNRVFAIIKSNNFKIELFGHTDSDGEENYNNTLSQNRANAVRNYLIKKGLTANQVSAKGLGESQPIESNDTDEGKAKNRRVEVRFLK